MRSNSGKEIMTLEVGGWSGKVPNKSDPEKESVSGMWVGGKKIRGRGLMKREAYKKARRKERAGVCWGLGGSAGGNEARKAGVASLSITLWILDLVRSSSKATVILGAESRARAEKQSSFQSPMIQAPSQPFEADSCQHPCASGPLLSWPGSSCYLSI